MKQQSRYSVQEAQDLKMRAVRHGVNLRQVSKEGYARTRALDSDLLRGVVDASVYEALLGVVQRADQKWVGKINPPASFRPEPEASDVSTWAIRIPFWVMDTLAMLTLAFEHFLRGVAIYGPLGIGKTTAAGHLLLALTGMGIPCVIFDRKGTEFLFLSNRIPALVLTPGKDFHLNPFDGDFYEVILMMSIILDIFSRRDSQAIAQSVAETFFRTCAPRGETFSFRKFVEMVPAAKPICMNRFSLPLQQSLSAVISSIACSPMGQVFDCVKGLDISAMLEQGISLVIPTANLSSLMEEMLICIIAEKMYSAIGKNPNIPDHHGIKAGLYIDEASEYISDKLDGDQRHLGPLASYFLRARSRGIVNMFSCHNPSRISAVMKAAIHVQFAGRQSSGSDVKSVKDSMGLTDEQALSLLHLGIGEFCVKLGSGHTTPFLVKVDPSTW